MLDDHELNRLEREADWFLGTPFVRLGRDTKFGLDCMGFIIEFYKDAFGITVSDPAKEQEWITIQEKEAIPGDVVVFSSVPNCADHVAILMPKRRIIQSAYPHGVTRCRLSDHSAKITRYVRHRDRK